MKKYGWEAAYLSFFSRDLYRDVAQNWKGVGYLYLLLLLFALCAISAIGVQVQANAIFTKQIDPIIGKWPKMTIQNGDVSIDKPMPYIIQSGDNAIIDFDTSEGAKLPDGKKGWLITKDSVITNDIGPQHEENKTVVDFKQFASSTATAPIVIDQPTLLMWVGMMRNLVGVFWFFARMIQLLIVCMIQSLIYGLIGMLVANAMKIELTFGTLVRLTVVALTPGLILETISLTLGFPIPFWGVLSILVGLGYVVFAVSANKPGADAGVIPGAAA